jgi:hypothetical protein
MLTILLRRAKEKYRRRLLDKESVSDSELVTSTTPVMNRDDPLPRLGGSQVQPEGQIELLESLSRGKFAINILFRRITQFFQGLLLADVLGTRYADLITVWELFHHIC